MVGEGREEKGIVLEKVAGDETKPQRTGGAAAEGGQAYFFGDYGVKIGRDRAAGVAEEKGRTPLILGGGGEDGGARLGQLLVDGIGGDWATRDVDNVMAGPLAEKSYRKGTASRGLPPPVNSTVFSLGTEKCGVILERYPYSRGEAITGSTGKVSPARCSSSSATCRRFQSSCAA